jgi:hypothetical protein
MTSAPVMSSFARKARRIAFPLLVLLTVGRLIQLSNEQKRIAATRPAIAHSQIVDVPGSKPVKKATPDAELAKLYAMCPMAATIDLHSATESPESTGALLPPYRLTSDRVPQLPAEPAVPRIRYPIALRPGAVTANEPSENLRIARLPNSIPTPNATQGEWLVDPKDWYTSEEVPPHAVPPTQPAITSEPPAIIKPPANNPPPETSESTVPLPAATTDEVVIPPSEPAEPELRQPFDAPPQLPIATPENLPSPTTAEQPVAPDRSPGPW